MGRHTPPTSPRYWLKFRLSLLDQYLVTIFFRTFSSEETNSFIQCFLKFFLKLYLPLIRIGNVNIWNLIYIYTNTNHEQIIFFFLHPEVKTQSKRKKELIFKRNGIKEERKKRKHAILYHCIFFPFFLPLFSRFRFYPLSPKRSAAYTH